MKLIDLMNEMINEQNVTFICVIHENPNGGNKARGHLGTELGNKASTTIQLSLENVLIYVKYLKTRRTQKPPTLHLQYSEAQRELILADDTLIN